MTELQKVEFDILKEFVRICDELNLTYFLVCGSALGAVKYQGFIPWDDDVDVALPREDYKIFCHKAQEMLPKHIFLQNHVTDSRYPMIFSKLRNSNTTYLEKSLSKLPINHGVYIDVFPLDGYPISAEERHELERKKLRFQKKMSCVYYLPDLKLKARIGYRLRRILGYHRNTNEKVREYEQLISSYPIRNSTFICNHGNWQGDLEYATSEQYGNGTWADFEGLRVRIPEKYDAYLTQKYGNWRGELPPEEQEGHHYYTVLDLKKSYKEYI